MSKKDRKYSRNNRLQGKKINIDNVPKTFHGLLD